MFRHWLVKLGAHLFGEPAPHNEDSSIVEAFGPKRIVVREPAPAYIDNGHCPVSRTASVVHLYSNVVAAAKIARIAVHLPAHAFARERSRWAARQRRV